MIISCKVEANKKRLDKLTKDKLFVTIIPLKLSPPIENKFMLIVDLVGVYLGVILNCFIEYRYHKYILSMFYNEHHENIDTYPLTIF